MVFDRAFIELSFTVFQVNVGCVPKKVQFSFHLCCNRQSLTWDVRIFLICMKIHAMSNLATLPLLTGYVECSSSCWVSSWSQWLRLWRWKCSFQLGVSCICCFCSLFFFFFWQPQWALLKPAGCFSGTKCYPFQSTTSRPIVSFVASLQPTSLSLWTTYYC